MDCLCHVDAHIGASSVKFRHSSEFCCCIAKSNIVNRTFTSETWVNSGNIVRLWV